MKQQITLGVAALILGLTQPAAAQPIPPASIPPYPGFGTVLPPYEIVAIVRSTGLEPLSRPQRQGPTYALRAVEPAGQHVWVIVDARIGRILRVMPLPRHGPVPAPYGHEPAQTPGDSGPNSRTAAFPPGIEGPALNERGYSAAAMPIRSAPLPRPRPKIPEAASSPAAAASAAASLAKPHAPIAPAVSPGPSEADFLE